LKHNPVNVTVGEILEVMYMLECVVTKYTTDTIIKGNMQIVFSISKGPSATPDPDPAPETPGP